jgi:membrane protease YdiL (CAAX protease family)
VNLRIFQVNHAALNYAWSVKQPPLWVPLSIWAGVLLLERVAGWLFSGTFYRPDGQTVLARALWLLGEVTLPAFALMVLHRTYPEALRTAPAARISRVRTIGLVALFVSPWFFQHIGGAVLVMLTLKSLSTLPGLGSSGANSFANMVEELNLKAWEDIAYGNDKIGILLGTSSLLVCAIYEEAFFRGYLLTETSRRFTPWLAVLLTATVFAVFHINRLGLSFDLLVPFLAGIMCGAVRLITGRWTAAAAAHVLCNAFLLTPKWIVSVYAFRAGVIH